MYVYTYSINLLDFIISCTVSSLLTVLRLKAALYLLISYLNNKKCFFFFQKFAYHVRNVTICYHLHLLPFH